MKALTTGQVALVFGVSRETVRTWAASGRLVSRRTLGGQRRFDPADIASALKEQADVPDRQGRVAIIKADPE